MKVKRVKVFGFAVAKKKVKYIDGQCNTGKRWMRTACLNIAFLLMTLYGKAQDGNAGLEEANTKVRSYFESGCNLMYAVGAVLGLVGAIKVYSKWNHGDPDTGKVAAAWFGSCVFLVVVATVIKSFFGI